MKTILIALFVLSFAAAASAQSTVKLFDPVSIGVSDYNVIANSSPWGMYKQVDVYLVCPTSGRVTSTITGPNGGPVIVDNAMLVNNTAVCQSTNCFSSLIANPATKVGMPVEEAYVGVGPINISRQINASGLYTFQLLDFGSNFGNSAVYLNTACTIIPVNTPDPPTPTTSPSPSPSPDARVGNLVCHRDGNNGNGNGAGQTLEVGNGALQSHLAHGDTVGACSQ